MSVLQEDRYLGTKVRRETLKKLNFVVQKCQKNVKVHKVERGVGSQKKSKHGRQIIILDCSKLVAMAIF